MIVTDVVSSNILKIGFHRGTMYIQFKSGDCYAYEHVTLKEYNALVSAESVGQAFYKEIRSRFPYTKLTVNPFETKVEQEPTLKEIAFRAPLSEQLGH